MSPPEASADHKLLGSVGQAMINALPTLVSYVDPDLVYRFCNQAYEEWFQVPTSDIVGKKTVPEVIGDEAFANIRDYAERALGGEACGYEMPLTLPNGLTGYFRCNYVPHFDDHGKVIGFFAVIENTTERREVENRLAERQRTLELALDAGKFGTWVVDIEQQIAELDATLAGIIQMPERELHLPLDRFVELVAEEDRQRVAAAVDRTINHEADFSEQYRMLVPDGSRLWLSTYGKIHRDESGVADRVIGVTHDITAQKEAEQRLRKLNEDLQSRAAEHAEALQMSEANLRAIVGTAADAILTVSDQRTILSANPSAVALFGTEDTPNALFGMSIDHLLKSPSIPLGNTDDQIDIDRSAGGPPTSRSILGRRLDGSEFPAEFSLAHEPGVPFSVVLVRDVSQRREFESAVLRAAEVEKERIARDLHDGLGSLLGGVTCLAKALENELKSTDHPAVEKANQIGKAAQESVTMTRHLAHGLYAVGAQPDALVEALGEFAQMTDASFDVTCRFDCPESIDVDKRFVANHLFRIAQEAVNNAVRHSGAKSVKLALAREPDGLQLSVTDDGSGFGHERPEVKSDDGSEGLGLRTMHYRADEIHGHLQIESNASGTTVTCRVSE